ncbi:MAG: cell wall-binding repeat-containing protein [Acidimicrobiia bacterium]
MTSLAGLVVPTVIAQTPDHFPAGSTLDTSAYTLRLAGADRFQTAGTMALVSAVNGPPGTGYPFNSADSASPNAAYATGVCPTTVAIAASDTPADALSAAAAWDTQLDGVPFAATTGQADNVQTGDGVILLTAANRTGGNADLSTATSQVLNQILAVPCPAPNAVIFGGTTAVSEKAESTLDSLVGTVYRFAGDDRFDTARQVAQSISLGNAGLGFVNHFPNDEDPPEALDDTVFLAEGRTGADALAIGPYAAFNAVPILTTDSTSLPAATSNGLTVLQPDNIVVLGGTSAISEATAQAAATAAGGATVTRIAGANRYDSSVEIARQLFNYYEQFAADNAGEYSEQAFGFARSEGAGAAHTGWPDALASSWWLATLFANGDNPLRAAPPVERNDGPDSDIGGGDRELPALLLTTAGSLPGDVDDYLGGLYPDSDEIFTPDNLAGISDGGFGFLFGGTSAISDGAAGDIASLLSGGTYTSANRTDLAPTVDEELVFYTDLDFSDYSDDNELVGGPLGAITGVEKVCAFRNAFEGVQFLAAVDADDFVNAAEIDYQGQPGPVGDDMGYEAEQSRFTCSDLSLSGEDATTVHGTSLSGHETGTVALDWSAATSRLSSVADLADPAPDSTTQEPAGCDVFGNQADATECTVTTTYTGPANVVFKNIGIAGATFELELAVTATDPAGGADQTDAVTAVGTLEVISGGSTVFTASLVGESATAPGVDPFQIAGYYLQGSARGGFHLSVALNLGLSDLAFQGLAS